MNCKIMGFLCVVAWGLGVTCQASILLDQVNEVQPGQWAIALLGNGGSRAQTFTVGQTGKLARIEVGLTGAWQASAYWVDIAVATVADGVPDFDSILASRRILSEDISLPYPSVPKYSISGDFTSSEIQVTAGEMLALVVTSNLPPVPGPPTNVFGIWVNGNSYPNGKSYYRPYSEISEAFGDFHFRTFVEIPEPISASLGMLGVACVLAMARNCCASRCGLTAVER